METNNDYGKIKCAFENNRIAIVFESSDLFVPYLCVAIKSILNNICKENVYDIIILSHEIDYEHEQELKKMCEKNENVCIRMFNPEIYAKKYIEKDKYNYLRINFYRLLLPWILREYDIAINLGADILVCKNIAELYSVPFGKNKYLAGVRDLGYLGRLKFDIPLKELDLKFPNNYVNADVLVYNLKAIRENYDKDWIMGIWQKKRMRCAEQDALNLIFNQHIYLLDQRWNVFPPKMNSENDIFRNTNELIMEWKKSLKNPFLIHYAAFPKPWDYPMVGEGIHWWEVARQTVYYEEILRRMCMNSSNNVVQMPKKQRMFFKLFPMGSRRLAILIKIFPKGSRIRKMVKRIIVGKE